MIKLLVALPGLFFTLAALAAQPLALTLDDGTELSLSQYAAKGERLYIWLPNETGLQPSEHATAKKLAKQGIEVWLVDLFESRFLPVGSSSLDRIPPSDVSTLLAHAAKTGKQLYLISSGHGILPLLRGARLWQSQNPNSGALRGVILLSPKFYVETPDPGEAAQLLPIVSRSNLPVFVIQPRLSPWYWKLPHTIPALELGGSDVYLRLLSGVRDRFYFRPDATAEELAMAARLPALLTQSGRMLADLPVGPRRVVSTSHTPPKVQQVQKKKAHGLKPYPGKAPPPPLRLASLRSKPIDLRDYRGKVVLVNFWASWCPPCVHEMPSMQRLQNKLAKHGFTILGVNMAESSATIKQFLDTKVKVNFPILLDTDGAVLKSWGVFAFPTSFVIDKKGRIRYALFGSVEWDSKEKLAVIQALLDE